MDIKTEKKAIRKIWEDCWKHIYSKCSLEQVEALETRYGCPEINDLYTLREIVEEMLSDLDIKPADLYESRIITAKLHKGAIQIEIEVMENDLSPHLLFNSDLRIDREGGSPRVTKLDTEDEFLSKHHEEITALDGVKKDSQFVFWDSISYWKDEDVVKIETYRIEDYFYNRLYDSIEPQVLSNENILQVEIPQDIIKNVESPLVDMDISSPDSLLNRVVTAIGADNNLSLAITDKTILRDGRFYINIECIH